MATPRKERKGHTRITCDLLQKMDELHILGLPTKKIAPLLNISESTAKRYVCVLNAIHNKTDFCLAGDLCWGAITDFCVMKKVPMPANLHGVPEPKEPEQIEMKIKDAEPTLSCMIISIADALYSLAEYLQNISEEA